MTWKCPKCGREFSRQNQDHYCVKPQIIDEKILKPRGLLKQGAMCCRADVINYGNLPYTDFRRTKTLCQGGDSCDFLFFCHKTDAGDGWQRTRSV